MSTSPNFPPLSYIKLPQINLKYFKTANKNAKKCLLDNSIETALLKDAYFGKAVN